MVKREADNDIEQEKREGHGIDPAGGSVVDPTKNVLDLVKAESKYQDAQRDSLEKLLSEKVDALKELLKTISDNGAAHQNAQRDAETRRIDELAGTRQEFQNTIRDMLAESVRTTSTLVSTQLVQIQATFDTRVSKLEAGAFTQAGRQAVSDPEQAAAMTRMSSSIAANAAMQAEAMNKIATINAEAINKLTSGIAALKTVDARTETRGMAQGQVIGWIVGAAMLIAAIVSPIIAFLALKPNSLPERAVPRPTTLSEIITLDPH